MTNKRTTHKLLLATIGCSAVGRYKASIIPKGAEASQLAALD